MRETRLHVVVADAFQLFAHRRDRADRGQTLLHVVAVLFEVLLDETIEQGKPMRLQRLVIAQDLNFERGLSLFDSKKCAACAKSCTISRAFDFCSFKEVENLSTSS